MMTPDLFDDMPPQSDSPEALGSHACVLRRLALPRVPALLPALDAVLRRAPFRHMLTPGGRRMSVALSNCGELGWISDRHGYRYVRQDPDSGLDWPPIPDTFLLLAHEAADRAGFSAFTPDACLINCYLPGAQLSLHQDRDELDLDAPIVSVSLGIPALFRFGGHSRNAPTVQIPLLHGDVVVWGGPDRLRFHGVSPVKPASHPLLGARRINFTFRKAG